MLIVTTDDRAFRASLAKLYKSLSNLTPVMQDIGIALESRISGRFESRTDPNGKGWAPWAQSTIANYPVDGNRRLLDRHTPGMLDSLSHKADATSVRVGFGKPYATFHEFGTEHMPRRGLLFAVPEAGTLSDGDNEAVLDVLEYWLNAELG